MGVGLGGGVVAEAGEYGGVQGPVELAVSVAVEPVPGGGLAAAGGYGGRAGASIARTDTFLGERYRRIARRRGSQKPVVAVGRSLLVIIWHLLSDPGTSYSDLGSDFFDTRINPEHRKRNHIRQLEALGYKVTLEPAA